MIKKETKEETKEVEKKVGAKALAVYTMKDQYIRTFSAEIHGVDLYEPYINDCKRPLIAVFL